MYFDLSSSSRPDNVRDLRSMRPTRMRFPDGQRTGRVRSSAVVHERRTATTWPPPHHRWIAGNGLLTFGSAMLHPRLCRTPSPASINSSSRKSSHLSMSVRPVFPARSPLPPRLSRTLRSRFGDRLLHPRAFSSSRILSSSILSFRVLGEFQSSTIRSYQAFACFKAMFQSVERQPR